MNVAFFSDDNAIYMPEIIGDFLGDSVDIAAVIVSREENKMRSNSFAVASTRLNLFDIDSVYHTYMDGGNSIEMPSDVYLDNNVGSTTGTPHIYKNGAAVTFPFEVPATTTDIELGQIMGNVDINANSVLVRYFSVAGGSPGVSSVPADGSPHGGASLGYLTLFEDGRVVISGTASGIMTVTKMVLITNNQSYTL